jgi:hypothetical protein
MSQDLNAGIHSHIAGLEKNMGKPIAYWVDMVRSWNEPKHMANVKRLKESGHEFLLSGKKKYYSIRSKKQVGCLVPATKGRFEVWINVKGQEPIGNL